MTRKILLTIVIMSSLKLTAQEVTGVDFTIENDRVNVVYDLSAAANSITLFIDKGDQMWRELKNVSGDVGTNISSGHNKIVWDLLSEYPDGISADVRFLVQPNYSTPSLDDIDLTKCPFNKSDGIIWGTKAYFGREINYSKKYAGDLRKGTLATATDNISFSGQVMEYDFLSKEWRTLDISPSFSARVPRKTHNGTFPEPRIPSFYLYVDNDGNLRFYGYLVAQKL